MFQHIHGDVTHDRPKCCPALVPDVRNKLKNNLSYKCAINILTA